MATCTLYRVLAVLLALIAVALVTTRLGQIQPAALEGPVQAVAGVVVGAAIGAVAALMGVAGGELLIPTIVLLYGVDIKIAGSLSLMVSLPTTLAAFARYSGDRSFTVLTESKNFALAMAVASVLGTVIGGALLGVVPSALLVPLLALLRLVSARKVWQHG